jgi:hypothetical protein
MSSKKSRVKKMVGGGFWRKSKKSKQNDYIANWMKEIDDIFIETTPIPMPQFTPEPPEIYTDDRRLINNKSINNKSKNGDVVHLIKFEPHDNTFRGLENHINKILVKCQSYKPVIKFIQCFIKNKTQNNQSIKNVINTIQVNKSSVETIKHKLITNNDGLDILNKDDLAIIEAYAKIDPIFEYLVNVLKMICQFIKGTGYFTKTGDLIDLNLLSPDLLNEACNADFFECPTQRNKEIQYILAITERASIYNLFLPDKSTMNQL